MKTVVVVVMVMVVEMEMVMEVGVVILMIIMMTIKDAHCEVQEVSAPLRGRVWSEWID